MVTSVTKIVGRPGIHHQYEENSPSKNVFFFVYKHINIQHQNINGSINEIYELTVHLHSLGNNNNYNPVDILCLSEHNMTISFPPWIYQQVDVSVIILKPIIFKISIDKLKQKLGVHRQQEVARNHTAAWCKRDGIAE